MCRWAAAAYSRQSEFAVTDADLDELGADRLAARTTPSKKIDIVLALSLALMVAVIGSAAMIASADYLLRLLGH